MGRVTEITTRRAGRIAGVGYLVIFVLSIFANFVVFQGLVDLDDAAGTAQEIGDAEGLFRLGLIAFLVIFLVDVVIAWAIYVVFRDQSRDFSLLSAWLRLVYTIFLGVALVFFFQALRLLSGRAFLEVFDVGQLEAQALVALESFNAMWLIGLAAFGLHLVVLGRLIVRSGVASRVLGHILTLAGAAYVLDTVAHGLLADYDDYEAIFLTLVVVPSVIGELWLGLWLLLGAGTEAPKERGGPERAP